MSPHQPLQEPIIGFLLFFTAIPGERYGIASTTNPKALVLSLINLLMSLTVICLSIQKLAIFAGITRHHFFGKTIFNFKSSQVKHIRQQT